MNLNNLKASKRMNEKDGFTLIEVLFTLAIFAIGMLALAALQTQYIRANASSRMQTESTVVASQWLERLKVLPDNHADLDAANNPHQRTDGAYQVTWNVADDTPIAEVKTITITVTSSNPNARPVNMSYRHNIDS